MKRQVLLEAILPAPEGMPALAELDLSGFWRRFDATAPIHVRAGLLAATLALVEVMPRVCGHTGSLDSLSDEEKDRVLQRAAELPLAQDLLAVGKIVACLAYFDDPSVEDIVRGNGS